MRNIARFNKWFLVGLFLLVIFTTSLSSSTPALADTDSITSNWSKYVSYEKEVVGGRLRVHGNVSYRNGHLYANWTDCNVLHMYGHVEILRNWCGVYKNGSSDWLELGYNYTVHQYSPIGGPNYTYTGNMRLRVYANGSIIRYG